MKKLVFLTLIMVFAFTNIKAQFKMISNGEIVVGDTSQTPISPFDVYGNLSVGTATSAGTIGKVQITTGGSSPINNRLTFGTDNSGWKFAISKNYAGTVSDLMIIQDNGNVGIGTTNPGAKLDIVNGSQEIQLLSGTNTSGYMGQIGVNDDGVNFSNNSGFRGFNFKNNNGTLVTIATNGYVGIGTTSPSSLLSVGSSSQFQVNSSGNIVMINNVTTSFPSSQGGSGTFLQNNGSGTLSWAAISGLSGGTTNYIPKWSSSTTLSSTSLLYDNGTNVGIGTTSPTSLLNVYDIKNATYSPTAAPTISLRLDNNNNAGTDGQYASMGFVVKSVTDGNTPAGHITLVQPDHTAKNGNFTFTLRNSLGYYYEMMRIQSDGTVGIGTTTPNNLLQVKNLINFDNSSHNTFLGYYAGGTGSSSATSTAIGYAALSSASLSGSSNTAIGMYSLYENTTGYDNTATGYLALNSDLNGYSNTANGYDALGGNANGNYNTALGYIAESSNSNDTNCTYVGYNAHGSNSYSNSTAIGNGATATARNYIAVGNTSVKTIAGQVAFTTYSDGRFKFNIQKNVKGLEFIKKLNPVTYQTDTKMLDEYINAGRSSMQIIPHTHTQTFTDSTGTHTTTTTTYDTIKIQNPSNADFASSTAIVHSGFIAQSVDSAANVCGFKSSIVHRPENGTDPYALSYSEIVVPLVKALQELSKTNDSLKNVQKTTDSLLTVLQKQFNTTTNNLQQQINNCCNNGTVQKTINQDSTIQNSTNSNNGSTAAILYQNTPNPFSQQTQIKCFIPANAAMSYLYIYDMQGMQLRKIQINGKAEQNITIQGYELKAGMYMYSLIIDGKIIDTKKMVLTD